MTTRLLLSGYWRGPIAHRNRRVDGRLFGVAAMCDTDCGSPRPWTIYVNALAILERCEKLKNGEPVTIAGPFSVRLNGERLDYRITAESIVGGRKERKKRAKNNPLLTVNPGDAPTDDDAKGDLNDELPF